MQNYEVITPIFYVRGMNAPYTEGHIQVVNNIVKALASQDIESIVFNYKYRLDHEKNHEIFCGKRYEQNIPIVYRETLFHERKKLAVAYSSLMEAISTIKFMLNEKSLKRNGHRYVANVVNCFKYPRVLTKTLFRTPLIVHFYMRRTITGRFVRIVLEKADKIVASSKTVANHVEKTYSIEMKKIAVLYPPIDVDFYRPIDKIQARKNFSFSEEDKIVLYIGNLVENRFPEGIVLQTFQDLIEEDPRTKLLVFAPQNNENMQRSLEIRAKIKKLHLGDYVKVNVQNLSPTEKAIFYGLSDLFIFPSLNSSSAIEPPLTVLESMSSGLPVVSNDLPSVREIITDGANGLIVSYENEAVARLTHKFCSLLGDIEVRTKLSVNARQSIVEQMSLADSGKKLVEIYEDTVQD